MKRRKLYRVEQPEPVIDRQDAVSRFLGDLIREALTASRAAEPGYMHDYNAEKQRREKARDRAKRLRRLRDEFELTMAGVDSELEPSP